MELVTKYTFINNYVEYHRLGHDFSFDVTFISSSCFVTFYRKELDEDVQIVQFEPEIKLKDIHDLIILFSDETEDETIDVLQKKIMAMVQCEIEYHFTSNNSLIDLNEMCRDISNEVSYLAQKLIEYFYNSFENPSNEDETSNETES